MPCMYTWLPGCRPLRRDSSARSAGALAVGQATRQAPVTRCSRDGSDASLLGAAASTESSPRFMPVPLLVLAAAAAAFLLAGSLRPATVQSVVYHGRAPMTVQ